MLFCLPSRHRRTAPLVVLSDREWLGTCQAIQAVTRASTLAVTEAPLLDTRLPARGRKQRVDRIGRLNLKGAVRPMAVVPLENLRSCQRRPQCLKPSFAPRATWRGIA